MSPESAISDMVAPVVLITLAIFIGNGMLSTAIAIAGMELPLEQECAGILRGPTARYPTRTVCRRRPPAAGAD
jgi:hypothetical protein